MGTMQRLAVAFQLAPPVFSPVVRFSSQMRWEQGWLLADVFLRAPAEGGLVLGWQFDAARKGGYALSLAPREDFTVALNLIALAILIWLGFRLRGLLPFRRGR